MRFADRLQWQKPVFAGPDALVLRDAASASGLLAWFVLASLPVYLVALARETAVHGLAGAARGVLLPLLVSLFVSLTAHLIFARVRHRRVDPAWLMHGWLFALLIPVDFSLSLVALGAGFGVIVGSLIFGGSGRNIVSPALLGVVFLQLAYPSAFAEADAGSTFRMLMEGKIAPDAWWPVFLQHDAASPGAVSAAACVLGALVLYAAGAISLRAPAGAVIGAALAALAFGGATPALPAYWHWIVGSFAFCTVFVLTDPAAQSVTRPGRWVYGGLAGFLAVTLRVLNPEHPEGTLAAILLAALFAPLIDQIAQRVLMWRWHRRRAR